MVIICTIKWEIYAGKVLDTHIEPENNADKFSVAMLNSQVIIHSRHSNLFEDTAMSMATIRVTSIILE